MGDFFGSKCSICGHELGNEKCQSSCGHSFHFDCYFPSGFKNGQCPICLYKIPLKRSNTDKQKHNNRNKLNEYKISKESFNPGDKYKNRNQINEISDEYYKIQKQKQMQMQIERQKQQMKLDYSDVSDIFMSLLATAEVIVFQKNEEEKKYGYYDEYDAAYNKTFNSQIIQFLRHLREFKGAKEDYENSYNKQYELPDKLTIEKVKYKIKKLKEQLPSNSHLVPYFDEIINILINKSSMNFRGELEKYYDKNIHLTEEQIERRFDNLIGAKHLCAESDQKILDEMDKTGDFNYNIVKGAQPGRLIKSEL